MHLLIWLIFVTARVWSQNVGTSTPENHPPLTYSTCTPSGCTPSQGEVVIDSNWRWTHNSGGTNCYSGNTWSTTICPDPTTCTNNCYIEGADYPNTYGITTSGGALSLKFVTVGQYSTNIGSRLYLMDSPTTYKMFSLKNREFTFDVDVSKLPCGLNGALYFVSMEQDGGKAKYAGNKCGAKYGTGYCDAQCPHDIKWINGEANVLNWTPNPKDPNSGSGLYGSCCFEMDIWEANSQATAYTPHPCNVSGPYRCSGGLCGDDADRYRGVCDKDGCDFNSWRMGDTSFYGTSMTVDTTKVFSVVTQFITSDGTDSGDLTEIRRYYVQNGVVIPNSYTNFVQIGKTNAVTSQFCTEQKTLFGDPNDFDAKGGLVAMGREMDKGMVLVMSLWDDHSVNMLWLDSNFPATASPSTPGVARGPCATTSGVPSDVESSSPGATVVFSNIKYGTIGSTFTQPTPTPSPPPSNPPATPPAPPTAPPTAAPTVPPTAAPTNAPSSGSQITNQNGAGAPSDNGGWIAFAVLLVLNVIVVVLVVVLARKGMLKMSSKGESV